MLIFQCKEGFPNAFYAWWVIFRNQGTYITASGEMASKEVPQFFKVSASWANDGRLLFGLSMEG